MVVPVQVQCPHCGAKGQLMLPGTGAMLIGTCPHCGEMVLMLLGACLPLEKEVFESGSMEEKHSHILSVLTEFLSERIADALQRNESDEPEESEDADEHFEPETLGLISREEIEQFSANMLPMLDNREYFDSIFQH